MSDEDSTTTNPRQPKIVSVGMSGADIKKIGDTIMVAVNAAHAEGHAWPCVLTAMAYCTGYVAAEMGAEIPFHLPLSVAMPPIVMGYNVAKGSKPVRNQPPSEPDFVKELPQDEKDAVRYANAWIDVAFPHLQAALNVTKNTATFWDVAFGAIAGFMCGSIGKDRSLYTLRHTLRALRNADKPKPVLN